MTLLEIQALSAKNAQRRLARASAYEKNEALEAMAGALVDRREEWLAANAQDLESARREGMRPAMLDRLALDERRVAAAAQGIRQIAALPDPVGQTVSSLLRPNGLRIERRRTPLGVVGIIYEARPNVTVDAAALCIKAGNAVLLRGGREASRSNRAAIAILRDALEHAHLPRDCASLVDDSSRESAEAMMGLTEYLDVLIPRGGPGLIRHVAQNARVPVIRTGEGLCHIYVHAMADLDMAARILYNAKCSRPSVCNAAECVLVDRAVAADFLPMAWAYLKRKQVTIHGDPEVCAILDAAVPAVPEDWDTEYGDYQLSAHVVSGLEEAEDFIAAHGTGHSETIVTQDYAAAQRFLDEVDAAAVYVNASTRFTDGGQFGLGAEIGISTQKLHARGPMGLEELTTTKYVVYGSGQVRE